jgi:PTS system cellobiose-specific IIC component
MKNVMKWFTEKFAPALMKVTDHPLISSISQGFIIAVPLILVGTFAMIATLLKEYIPFIPDLTPVQNFSFGLMGLFVVFAIAYTYTERKNPNGPKIEAGFVAIGGYLMLSKGIFNADTWNFEIVLDRLGAAGVFLSVVVGLFTGVVISFFANRNLFNKKGVFPDFIVNWFNTLASGTVILVLSWLVTYPLGFDMYALVENLFSPLVNLGQSYAGFVLIWGISILLYAFGLSAWTLWSIIGPITLAGIAENADLVAKGLAPVNINTQEVGMAFIWLGGMGMTLMLNVMMLRSKSKRLKTLGQTTMLPSIMNINEPLVFGVPIAFNPLLMIPFIINGFLIPLIVYPVLNSGLVNIPAFPFYVWFAPIGFTTFIVTQDWMSIPFLAILLAITWFVYWPFFKAYEKQELQKEAVNESASE